MKTSVAAISLAAAFSLQIHAQPAQPRNVSAVPPCMKVVFPGRSWKQEKKLQKAGWSKTDLLEAQKYAGSLHDQSMMTIECGRLVDAWGNTSRRVTTFSVRKSLISALFGIYAAEGKIDLTETLEQTGIDDAPSPLTKEERQARAIDLLRARSGVYHAASFETDFQRKIRPVRGSHVPGSFWFYNNWDFNALGTLFKKKTGLKIGEAFYQRIAKPIGMQDFRPEDVYYVEDESVSEHPAYMFKMTTRYMARFGLLYLN